jgi:cell division inhibitor SulA
VSRAVEKVQTFWTLSVAEWLAIAGLVIGLAGFAITIWQLVRTARASEATAAAVERTERHMAASYLLVLLPQFRVIESDLDNAAVEDDRRLAMRALRTYADVASEVRTLLTGQGAVDAALLTKLEETARAATLTKAALVDNPGRPTKNVTREFRNELSEVSTYVGGLTARFTLGATSA